MIDINLATSIPAIAKCYPVLAQLHPSLSEADFIDAVHVLQSKGYQLASLSVADQVKSVAGFHLAESLGWRKYLYIDDLATDETARSQGYGQQLFQWLIRYGQTHACEQLHLDSRVTRYAAHKFYLNQGMIIGGYHFMMNLNHCAEASA